MARTSTDDEGECAVEISPSLTHLIVATLVNNINDYVSGDFIAMCTALCEVLQAYHEMLTHEPTGHQILTIKYTTIE